MMDERLIFQQIDVSHYMLDPDLLNLVVPGDLITSEPGFMNGHGTYRSGEKIYSTLMGTVETTNKLIIVNPLRSRYAPQIGDIVVGVVSEIANKRWKVDIRAAAYAYLSLNSTYIPEQRKKNEEDEFNMRRILKEGDVLVAEVHSLNNDSTYNLHTRNPKYGRLEAGFLVEVSHRMVKRQKHHLLGLGGVGLILGNNGNVYLSHCKRNDSGSSQLPVEVEVSQQSMRSISLIGNMLKVLNLEGLEISEGLLKDLLDFVEKTGLDVKAILEEEGIFRKELLERVRMRVPRRIEEISSSLKKK